MYKLLESLLDSYELYQSLLTPVCHRYGLSHTEMGILLFLADNPEYDTASAIVSQRHLTKSSVSMAGKSLQEKGLIAGTYADGNSRSIHLRICEAAREIVREGREAEKAFLRILTEGFSEEEMQQLKANFMRMTDNVHYHRMKQKN